MTAALAPGYGIPIQFFDNSGAPLAGGKIWTYAAGTTTPRQTWNNEAQTQVNPNPIVLDSAGRTSRQIWLDNTLLYKFVVMNSANAVIRTDDNVQAVLGSASSPAAGDQAWGLYQSPTTITPFGGSNPVAIALTGTVFEYMFNMYQNPLQLTFDVGPDVTTGWNYSGWMDGTYYLEVTPSGTSSTTIFLPYYFTSSNTRDYEVYYIGFANSPKEDVPAQVAEDCLIPVFASGNPGTDYHNGFTFSVDNDGFMTFNWALPLIEESPEVPYNVWFYIRQTAQTQPRFFL